MLEKSYPYYLANRPVAANTDLVVLDKYSGKLATRVAYASRQLPRMALYAGHVYVMRRRSDWETLTATRRSQEAAGPFAWRTRAVIALPM